MRLFKIPAKTGSCYLSYCFINGSQAEPEGYKGLLHLIEHLHYRDSSSDRVDSIKKIMEGCGAVINAYTSDNAINFHCSFLPDDFNQILDCMKSIVFEKNFNDVDVDIEKQVVVRELIDYYTNPSSAAFLGLIHKMYEDGFTHVLGRKEDILSSTPEKLNTLYDMLFANSNLLVFLTGPQEFLDKVDIKTLAPEDHSLDEIPGNLKINFHKYRRPSYTEEGDSSMGTAYLRMGFMYPYHFKSNQEESYLMRTVMAICSDMLGGSQVSPMFKKLREEKGYCYSTGAGFSMGTKDDMFILSCDLDPQYKKDCLKTIDGLLSSFWNDKDLFDFTINKLIHQYRWLEVSGPSKVSEKIEEFTSGFKTPSEDFLRNEIPFDRFQKMIKDNDLFNPLKFSVFIRS